MREREGVKRGEKELKKGGKKNGEETKRKKRRQRGGDRKRRKRAGRPTWAAPPTIATGVCPKPTPVMIDAGEIDGGGAFLEGEVTHSRGLALESSATPPPPHHPTEMGTRFRGARRWSPVS